MQGRLVETVFLVGRMAILVVGLCVAFAVQAAAQTFTVNTVADELGVGAGNGRCETAPGNGVCTFRRAMWETSVIFGASTPSQRASVSVVLDVPDATVLLAAEPVADVQGGFGSFELVGLGAPRTVIDASGARLLAVNSGEISVAVSGVWIRNASAAIEAHGPLRVDHVRIDDSPGPGIVYFGGSATITAGEFNRNQNGAIYMQHSTLIPDAGVLRVRRSTFRDNRGYQGAGIWAWSGTVDLDGVTFAGNHALTSGGAVAVIGGGTLYAVNSTFSANSADESGGAVYAQTIGAATAAFSTFFGNTADADRNGVGGGGAIALGPAVAASSAVLTHNVVSDNTATMSSAGTWVPTPSACSGALTAGGPNLFDVADCTIGGVSPNVQAGHLGPLQDNGGFTPTHAPAMGSPASDGGSAGACLGVGGGVVDRDQRGRRRSAGAACDLGAFETDGSVVRMTARRDLNGDGRGDLLWDHAAWGRAAWFMTGTQIHQLGFLPALTDRQWQLLASDDVDGDGKADLIWRHSTTKHVAIWVMDGVNVRDARMLLPSGPTRLAGTGDVDGDGRADLVWEQEPRGTGEATVWFLDGAALKGTRRLPSATGWSLEGVGDANDDGTSDLLWRHPADGSLVVWMMSGGTVASGALLSIALPVTWDLAAFTDLNGDRKADLVWRQQAAHGMGTAAWLLDGSNIVGSGGLPAVSDTLWRLSDVLDTDGDGRADLVWRGTDGRNARWRMNGLTLQAVEFLPTVPDRLWQIK